MPRRGPSDSWTEHDRAIWHTCDIAAAAVTGRLGERPDVLAPFPPRWAVGEQMLANGSFELLAHRPLGDGSYSHDSGFLLATGRGGLALMAGAAVVRSTGNARRRRAATAAAAPRWVVVDGGALWVSTAGFYLQTPRGLFPWSWAAVVAATMTGPGSVHLQGEGVGGPMSWIVRSAWSELLFVLWALEVHPRHPQLLGGGWLPPGWLERSGAWGQVPTDQLDALATYRDGSKERPSAGPGG